MPRTAAASASFAMRQSTLRDRAVFPATHHSLVNALSDAHTPTRERAFNAMVRLYWKPVATYVLVRWPIIGDDAEDVTQSFFTAAFEGMYFARFDAARGRFRTVLRVCVDRHAMNFIARERRQKRGGQEMHISIETSELAEEHDPNGTADVLFRDAWVQHRFRLALGRLRDVLVASGREKHYEVFAAYDLAPNDSRPTYHALATQLGIAPTQVTNWLHATRRLLREIVVEELREAAASDAELRDDALALLGVDA